MHNDWQPQWTTQVRIESGGRYPLGTEEYGNTIEELISIALRTAEMFESLKGALRVRTAIGGEVKPLIFPHQHVYLQPEQVEKVKNSINAVRNSLLALQNSDIAVT
jgi:hypothetical protein